MSKDSLSLHLVELSPQMRQIQESALCGYFHGHSHVIRYNQYGSGCAYLKLYPELTNLM